MKLITLVSLLAKANSWLATNYRDYAFRYCLYLFFCASAFLTACNPLPDFFKNYQATVERENGMTCEELNIRAMHVVTENIRPIIVAEHEGKDWVAIADNKALDMIQKYEEPLFRCQLLQSTAQQHGHNIDGNFKTLHQLFSALDTFLTYSGDPPTEKGLKPEAFQRVDQLYNALQPNLKSNP